MAVYVKTATLADVALTGAYADLTGAPSLGSYAKTADLSKVALSGKFTDLTGGLTLGTSCGTGLVVKGLKVDGSLECVSLSSLPPDGLNEVSNGLLSNEFLDTFALDKVPVGISDNNPVGTGGEIDVPDVGVARALTVSVDVVNSDISSLRVVLYDPANNEYVLHDKTGKVGESVKTSYPTPTKSVSGDLTTWVGKNPKGKWRLVVIDGKFLNNATDGAIQAFSLTIETLSNGKTLAKGALVLQGGVQLPVYAKAPFACDASHYGYAYLDSKTHDLNVCRLKWSPVMFRECGNGLLEFPEECDNGVANSDTADKCRTTCVKAKCGDVIKDAAEFCDDGNGVNDDGCPNDCSNPNPSVVFTALVTGSQTPPLAVGSIPGKVGKKIVIQKVGMCGDSDATSGPNVFSVSGAGLSFTWAAGQSNPGPTHWLNPVPVSGASRGFSYADVNYAGQVGQGVTVSWDTHVDWDGLRCTGTDMMGNIYDDATASSLRVWLLYGYQ
jgi:cysteine-rich repeat protein